MPKKRKNKKRKSTGLWSLNYSKQKHARTRNKDVRKVNKELHKLKLI